MAESVNQGGAKSLVLYYLLPPYKRQVCGCYRRLLARPQRQMVEDLLSAFLVEAHIAELVADDEVVFQEALLQASQRPCRLCLAYLRQQLRHGCEKDGVPLKAGLYSQPD